MLTNGQVSRVTALAANFDPESLMPTIEFIDDVKGEPTPTLANFLDLCFRAERYC